MDTTLDLSQAHSSKAEETHAASKTKTATVSIWQEAEAYRYGINLLVLTLTILLGSISVPYAVSLSDWQFALVIFPCGFTLVLVMALSPLKWIIGMGAFALAMSLTMFFWGVAVFG